MAGIGITLQLNAAHSRYLEARGGHSHRGKATFSRSIVLARMLETLTLYNEFNDPRVTGGMPEEIHALVVRLLPEPWLLRRYEVTHLEGVLESTPGFTAAVTAAGVDPAALLAAVAAATLAEKLTLVDHAIQHQAPAAPTSGSARRRDRVHRLPPGATRRRRAGASSRG
jgi:hypothetical protein